MMHRQIVMEFRTPQHPSMGTNNWGGASPLLARDIPEKSLETRYLRLNKTRIRDEIFPVYAWAPPQPKTFDQAPARPRGGLFSKLRWAWREKKGPSLLGSTARKRSSWIPGGDPRTRWPQGWC